VEIQQFEGAIYRSAKQASTIIGAGSFGLKSCAWSSSMMGNHYSHLVIHHLNLSFSAQWISSSGHFQWPPRSPDLTPLDFCLWEWMESEVYNEKVKTRDKLVTYIIKCCPPKTRMPR
jgi:hypothetical protein